MSRTEKSLARLLAKPRDLSWDELTTVMEHFGYELKGAGGSSRKFIHSATRATLMMHEPHPQKILKTYQVLAVLKFLKQENHTS